MKKIVSVIILLTFIFLSVVPLNAKEKPPFKVIVNAANPQASLTRKEVSDLFLKKITHWRTGEEVLVAEVAGSSQLSKEFSRQIHGKKLGAINAYWQKLIYSGRDVPPPRFDSEKKILAYVQEKKGAIAYVSATTSLAKDKIKVVTIKK
ncbi:hypothetical protein MJD09_07510 [bacterium]|nr:hypothetical protein [bacterium]